MAMNRRESLVTELAIAAVGVALLYLAHRSLPSWGFGLAFCLAIVIAKRFGRY